MGAGASFIDVEELTEALEQDFARVVPRTPRGSLDVDEAGAGAHVLEIEWLGQPKCSVSRFKATETPSVLPWHCVLRVGCLDSLLSS